MRKLNTNKTQILHSIRLRNYNPQKPHEDNYQEAQWQIYDRIMMLQDDSYTTAWKAEIGKHLLQIPNIFADPNGNDFEESHTQGPDTVLVPRFYFHDSRDAQTKKHAPLLIHL